MKEVEMIDVVVEVEMKEETITRYAGSRRGWELTKGSEVVVTIEGESVSLFLAFFTGENEFAVTLFSWESGVFIASGVYETEEAMQKGLGEFLKTELSSFLDKSFNDLEFSKVIDLENLERIEKLIGKKPTSENYPVAGGVH